MEVDTDLNPLDNENLKIADYFKSFIKHKSIEELISEDNKLFTEIRNLESEKHILVTQNYKKFVTATETINTIKSSLIGFEKDLMTLQLEVKDLVNNFDIVNDSISNKLNKVEDIYKVKKDLKRIKFINDLPNILENQLKEYINQSDKTNIRILEKSLIYYEKCKDFLILHRDNSLVKDIYSRTKSLIFQYRNLIYDQLHMPDFNEFSLEMFDICVKLLVKIEEDNTELINIFLDRYKYLINKKYDEIFSIQEGVTEINYNIYSKIYDNYEFAINENEFLFYENQIEQLNGNNSVIELKNLTSKFFKKGTFIWICKKVNENIISYFINLAHKYFVGLFGINNSIKLNYLYDFIIDVFYKKVEDFLNNSKNIDPEFFKEGLSSFYYPMSDTLFKINHEDGEIRNLNNKISNYNMKMTEIYLNHFFIKFSFKIAELIKSNVKKLINFDKKMIYNEANNIIISLHNILIENLQYIKKLDFAIIYDISKDREVEIYNRNIQIFIDIIFFVFKSCCYVKFPSMRIKNSNIIDDELHLIKNNINDIFSQINIKYRIYLSIIVCKLQFANPKILLEKILKEFPIIKNNRNISNELKLFLDKELNESIQSLNDSLIQLKDREYYEKLKILFYDVNWVTYDTAITFRKNIRDICYDLYYFKNELNELLEEEKKQFNETKMTSINELMLNKNKKKLSKFQKEMECLHIRRLSIYNEELDSPQNILYIISKIILKNINEFIKMKKFSAYGFQQIQIDMNLIKYIFRENIIIDLENILDGFFLEIMKNCSFNTYNPESFDESLIIGMLDEFRKEFKEKTTSTINLENL